MTCARFPHGAAALVTMRKSGRVPAAPVLVALGGALRFSNLTLTARAAERYDWRPVAALDVEVFASARIAFAELLRTLVDIAAAVPRSIALTFHEGPRVHCGQMRQLDDFALFDWLPTAIGPAHYAAARVIEGRLWRELGKAIPVPFDQALGLLAEIAKESAQEASESHDAATPSLAHSERQEARFSQASGPFKHQEGAAWPA